MKITELENKIKIGKVQMNRNFLIEKLEDSILPNKTGHFLYVSGKAGSGKTTVWLNLINKYYNKVYNRIYLYSPSCHSIGNKIKLSENRIRKNLSTLEADIQEIEEEYKEGLENGLVYSYLIIIDDLIGDINKMGRGKNSDLFKHLILNRGHINCSVIVASQKWREMPLIYRVNCSHAIVFPTKSKSEIDAIIQDTNLFFNEKEFRNALHFIWESKHSFCYIDMEHDKLYKRMEYEIDVDDEEIE